MKRLYCLLSFAGISGLINDISAMEQHKAAAECMPCYTGEEEKVTTVLAPNVDVNAPDELGNAHYILLQVRVHKPSFNCSLEGERW